MKSAPNMGAGAGKTSAQLKNARLHASPRHRHVDYDSGGHDHVAKEGIAQGESQVVLFPASFSRVTADPVKTSQAGFSAAQSGPDLGDPALDSTLVLCYGYCCINVCCEWTFLANFHVNRTLSSWSRTDRNLVPQTQKSTLTSGLWADRFHSSPKLLSFLLDRFYKSANEIDWEMFFTLSKKLQGRPKHFFDY